MRTFFKDYGQPYANQDDIAHAFRAALLPQEDMFLRTRSM